MSNPPLQYVPSYIHELQPYLPGMSIAELTATYKLEPTQIIKLASNENPYGMSPHVTKRLQADINSASRYPNGRQLAQALAHHYALEEANVILGNGSNDVLDLIARVFLERNSEAISSQYAFSIYAILSQMNGAKNVITLAREYGHDLSAIASALTPQTRIIWIANPNNPTGTFIPYADVKAFIQTIPVNVIVVLDEAYYEYLRPDERVDTTAWLAEFPNLIITRTFSKAYGLAGLRVGYGLAHESLIALLHRVRQPFNVNELGLQAGLAALDDQAFVRQSYEHNQAGLKQLTTGLDNLALSYLPTYGNFVTVACEQALDVHEALLQKGIIVRPLKEYGMPSYLRISVGLPQENDRLLSALQEILT